MAPLRIVVALEAEARPLAAALGLSRDPEVQPFKLYRGEDAALIVSGPGKLAAAAATAYLHLAAGGEPHAAWLNVGIAGCGERAVGEAALAHKVRDQASGEQWYPPLVFEPPCATGEVLTVDAVERGYAGAWLYEMEASGFLTAATRFASGELTHCLKVVSDNCETPPEGLSAAVVGGLIEGALGSVVQLATACRALAAELRMLEADPSELGGLLARWHFTVSERRQLRRLLRRAHALVPAVSLPEAELAGLKRGKEVRRVLEGWVGALVEAELR